MNLEQMQSVWQQHNHKLDECINLNKRLLQERQIESQKGELNKLILTRSIEGIVFFAIVVALGNYIAASWSLTAAVMSAVVLNIFALVGLAGSIGQVVLLSKIDFSKPVKQTLFDLITVRTHSLRIFKLLLLSAPFYMAYVFLGYDILLGVDLFSLMPVESKVIFSGIAVIFGVLVAFIITKLKPENRSNRLIGWLYNEIAGRRLTHLLDEFSTLLECDSGNS